MRLRRGANSWDEGGAGRYRSRIAIEGDDAAIGFFENGARVTASAERTIEENFAGLGLKRIQDLGEQHGKVTRCGLFSAAGLGTRLSLARHSRAPPSPSVLSP